MSAVAPDTASCIPPRHTVDLSLPPRERYKALAVKYKDRVIALTGLFNELLLDMQMPPSWVPTVNKFSKLILRRVHDSEQTLELRGISDETGVPMYLLVAFNVVLDLLMGCTSGAARCLEIGQPQARARMLHFRTLDWTMDPLRKVVVQIDFVRSQSQDPTKVLASSISYVGFTGVLTGVKQSLSMSLNFRPIHNAATKTAHFRFYFHHLLVLFGRRPSIASMLRQYLIEDRPSVKSSLAMADIISDLQGRHTTAAYIVLSDGNSTTTMEKDYATAKIKHSSSFIAITNHDKDDVSNQGQSPVKIDDSKAAEMRKSTGVQEIIEESTDRLHCIQRKWDAKVKRAQRQKTSNKDPQLLLPKNEDPTQDVNLTKLELVKWLCEWPTTNECTHFAAILDPSAGDIVWSRAYPEPLQSP